jgi:hypothetical protein
MVRAMTHRDQERVAAAVGTLMATGAPCVVCGGWTHSVGTWQVQVTSSLAPRGGKGRVIVYGYDGCIGIDASAFEAVEAEIERQAAQAN